MEWKKMTDKKKKTTIWNKFKTWLPIALFAGSALTASAENKVPNTHDITNKKETPADINHNIDNNIYSPSFKAYPGKYYNEICNGSPCWLSSTFETHGAGTGRLAKISSVAMWSANNLYRGINQMDTNHAKKFYNWLKDKKEFAPVYQSLSYGLGKANWQKTAKNYEHLMTRANEEYMVQKYNVDNMKYLQNVFNKKGIAISVKKLHPAIVSEIHKMTVQSPAAYSRIAEKTITFLKHHQNKASALNTEEYIGIIATSTALKNATVALFNDSTIQWNKKQFDELLSKVTPTHTDNKSWFEEHSE